MEPTSQSKEPHQPWKTEPVWDSQKWGQPISTSCQNPEEEEHKHFPETKTLVGEDGTVSISTKDVKVEPCSGHEEDGSSADLEFQPKKTAIWKLLGTTSYPLVPKWSSYPKHSKGTYSFPGYQNHISNAFHMRKTHREESYEAAEPTNAFCKIEKEPVSKPVFSPMLNSLLTVKTPMPEHIQENTQKLMVNHCTKEAISTLKDNPDQIPMKSSMKKTPPATTKPRGPYRAKINPSLRHSSDSHKSDFEKSSSTETVLNNSLIPVISSVHVSKESNSPSQSEKSIDQKPTPESRFLLIDDQGVPYTMMKREMENKPKEEGAAVSEEKAPIPKKVHYCLVCYRTFLYLSDLERHSITHSEHKPFECKSCGKTFKRSSHLQRHKHIHTGERPFLCPVCQKGFRESGELHRHQRTHTGEKPFQCDLCHLRFTERNTLRRHIKRKHTLDNLLQQDSDNLSDWGEAFAEAPEKDQQASKNQAFSDNAPKSDASSSPHSSPSLH